MPFIIRRTARASAAAVCAILALAACSVSQNIAIKNDGSGTLAMHAEVSPLLRDYLASIADVSGNPDMMKDGKVFDAAQVRKDFEARPGITVKKAVTPTPTSMDLEIAYTSLQDVFTKDEKLSSAGVLVYSESGGKKTVKLHLDRTNYTQLSALFPQLSDPMIASLGPQVEDTITDQEYLDMIQFTIGDDGPALLKKSYLTITIDPEGEILSQTGGTLANGAVTFKIPLLRILVLDKPLDYAVTFK
jgi:hypothetical protein